MAAAQHSIIFVPGEDFGFTLTIKDAGGTIEDLAGNTFAAEIRRASGDELMASFTCAVVGDGSTGQVSCTLPDTETIKLNPGTTYKWDLFRIESGIKTRLIYGNVITSGRITEI